MLTTFDKAIAALVVPLIVSALAQLGFHADEAFTAALVAIVTALVVWLVPNKEPAP